MSDEPAGLHANGAAELDRGFGLRKLKSGSDRSQAGSKAEAAETGAEAEADTDVEGPASASVKMADFQRSRLSIGAGE